MENFRGGSSPGKWAERVAGVTLLIMTGKGRGRARQLGAAGEW
jgi:hypothetical protein